MEGLNALYAEGIELLKTDPGKDRFVDCAERLRPLMARIQSATETLELHHRERQQMIKKSTRLSSLLSDHERLLAELLRRVRQMERAFAAEHNRLVPIIENHQSRHKARATYLQIALSTASDHIAAVQ